MKFLTRLLPKFFPPTGVLHFPMSKKGHLSDLIGEVLHDRMQPLSHGLYFHIKENKLHKADWPADGWIYGITHAATVNFNPSKCKILYNGPKGLVMFIEFGEKITVTTESNVERLEFYSDVVVQRGH